MAITYSIQKTFTKQGHNKDLVNQQLFFVRESFNYDDPITSSIQC